MGTYWARISFINNVFYFHRLLWHYQKVKNFFVIFLTLSILSGCEVAPVVDSSWISSNCTSVYYTPTPCSEKLSGCSCNESSKIKTCNLSDGGKYVGYFKGNNFHGKGDYYWKNGASFKGIWKNDKRWCGIEKNGSTYFLYRDGNPTQGEEGVDWGLVAGAAIIGAAAYAIADSSGSSGGNSYSAPSSSSTCTYTHNFREYTIENPNIFGGSCPLFHTYEEPEMCSIYAYHTRECDIGKACGDTCISDYKTCHVGRGSACNKNFKSYP